jgi:hypothetical protein
MTEMYVDKVLDAYRLSVKRWGRDILVATTIIVIGLVTIIVPFIRWSQMEYNYTEQLKPRQQRLAEIETFLNRVQAIENDFSKEKKDIANYAQSLVSQLSGRLSYFVSLVTAIREENRFESNNQRRTTTFSPQSQLQGVKPESKPDELLVKEYKLTPKEVALVTSTKANEQDTPERKMASEILDRVFQNEIKHIYDDLNIRVKEGFTKLKMGTEQKLKELEAKAKELDVPLPRADNIVLSFETIKPPSDIKRFGTVEAKQETLENEAKTIIEKIDYAKAPVQEARKVIVTKGEALKGSIDNLTAERDNIQNVINDLRKHVENAKEELKIFSEPFSLPLDWIPPLKIELFVRGYPSFVSFVFFILAIRFSRLNKLHARLYREYMKRGVAEEDIDLALHLPQSAFDWFTGLGRNSLASKVVRAVGPVLVLGLIVVSIFYIENAPPFHKTKLPITLHLVSVSLGLSGCYYFLRHLTDNAAQARNEKPKT